MRRFSIALAAAFALVMGATVVAAASPPFVEPEAEIAYQVTGDNEGDYFGWVAADVGDITGDGVTEVAVPAIVDPDGGPASGRVTVYDGSDGTELNAIQGGAFELFGYSVSGAGDVDGDGTPDYIIGAPGSGSSPDVLLGRALVVSGDDHSVIHELVAADRGFFGGSVAAAGDLNGDGYDDVTVGEQNASYRGASAGRVYAFSGRNGAVLWIREGREAGDLMGSALGTVGDVNGDGVPDVVAGAYGAKNGKGRAYILDGTNGRRIHTLRPKGASNTFARFFASGAGDVDGDGIGDAFVGDYNHGKGDRIGTGRAYVFSGATGRRILVLRAEHTGDGFGPGRGVGDVDGDGHADLIVAAYTNSDGAPFAGKAYVISGASGLTMRTITSTIENENFGVDALGLGDVDGDGLTDYMVTAVGLAFAGTDPGTAYVITGVDPDAEAPSS